VGPAGAGAGVFVGVVDDHRCTACCTDSLIRVYSIEAESKEFIRQEVLELINFEQLLVL